MDHSGGYDCSPSNTLPASVTVHVFKGKGVCGWVKVCVGVLGWFKVCVCGG